MSLQQFNRGAMMLHFTSAVGFGTYFLAKNSSSPPNGVELSLRDHQLIFSDMNYSYQSTENTVISMKSIQWLLISFFLITAFFHMYYYLADGFISNHYSDMILNKNNYIRWIEYSISATMMLYIIALISGVKDKNIYYLITATNIAMMSQGQWIEEALNRGGEWWVPMLTGFGLLLTEFYVIFRDFHKRQQAQSIDGFKPPVWMPSFVWVMFLFFIVFGLISFYNAVSKRNYYAIEVSYIIASFITKNWLGRYLALFVFTR